MCEFSGGEETTVKLTVNLAAPGLTARWDG